MTTQINDWKPEVRDVLNALVAAGCKLDSGDNGEERFKFSGELDSFIDSLIACDESTLYIVTPEGKRRWLSLVLGNEPGVIVSDYSVDPIIDRVTEAHYDKWENRQQPTRELVR